MYSVGHKPSNFGMGHTERIHADDELVLSWIS